MQKDKIFVWGSLTKSWEKEEKQKTKRKGKMCLSKHRVSEKSKERLKNLLKGRMKTNWGKQ